jgi:perosamine synthetase
MTEKLALFGGPKAVTAANPDRWPVLGDEEIALVTQLMRAGEISITSGTGVIGDFERAFAEFSQARYALVQCNGTSTLQSALFGVGVGYGDEVIVPTYTWPSTASVALTCNAIPVFCDIDPQTFAADPADIERKITPATKAICVVHLWGHPADMDVVMDIARRHHLKVVEDASHAHGAFYKGRPVGTIGDVGCFSMQASKALPGGEAGVAVTNDPDLFDRMLTYSHYGGRIERDSVTGRYLEFAYTGLGPKFRVHPLAAAIALVQLKKLPAAIESRRQNLEYLSEGLAQVPGLTPPYTAPDCTRGAWYGYRMIYDPAQFGGVPKERFMEALQAEGVQVEGERYRLLHCEPLYQGPGVAGACPFPAPDVRARMRDYRSGDFPVAEAIQPQLLVLPTFTYQPCWEFLDQYISAFRKVAANAGRL